MECGYVWNPPGESFPVAAVVGTVAVFLVLTAVAVAGYFIIDHVFYCGINSVVTFIGIFGNIILIIIFIHPRKLPHKSIFHTYLKVNISVPFFMILCDFSYPIANTLNM